MKIKVERIDDSRAIRCTRIQAATNKDELPADSADDAVDGDAFQGETPSGTAH
jgi:hypothetical protein